MIDALLSQFRTHRACVHATLDVLAKAPNDLTERAAQLRQLCEELRLQARIGDEVLYGPLLAIRTSLVFRDAIADHMGMRDVIVDLLLPDLEDADLSTARFASRVRVLRAVIDRHFKEVDDIVFNAAAEMLTACSPHVSHDGALDYVGVGLN